MNLWTFLSTAAGGGAFGLVLHGLSGLFDTWKRDRDQKLAIEMLRVQADLGEKSEAWKAFTASQQTNTPFVVPTSASPWAANLAVLVDAFTRCTRPGLTWTGAAFVLTVFLKADDATRTALAPEINFGAWTMMYWWFGARYQKK
jgi:hypothetical protein